MAYGTISHLNTTNFYKKNNSLTPSVAAFERQFSYFYIRVRSSVYMLRNVQHFPSLIVGTAPRSDTFLPASLLARPIHAYSAITAMLSIASLLYIYIYRHLHAQACWKLATVVKADLNLQNCRKSNFRYLGNGIQSAWIVSTFFPFSSTSLAVPISYFHPPRGSVKVGNFRRCFSLIREPEVT